MVCIPCLLFPLGALLLVLFDYIRPLFEKLGVLAPRAKQPDQKPKTDP